MSCVYCPQPCNCDDSLAQKAKLRRVGLKLAEKHLESIKPTLGEYGRDGHYPGDAHRRWAERRERVQRLMAALACLALFGCGGLVEHDPGITALCVTECLLFTDGHRACITLTEPTQLDEGWWDDVAAVESSTPCSRLEADHALVGDNRPIRQVRWPVAGTPCQALSTYEGP